MKFPIKDETILKIAIFATIFLLFDWALYGIVPETIILIIDLFSTCGLVVIGKHSKNMPLLATSTAYLVWSLISLILTPKTTLISWVLTIPIGLSLLTLKPVANMAKLYGLYTIVLSILVLAMNAQPDIMWGFLNLISILLLLVFLYQYLRTMRKPRVHTTKK
jgi:hypothetical protein